MKTIAIICTLTFLLCVGIVNGGTIGIMPVPGNGTSTTTTIIIALPPPTVTIPTITAVPSTTTVPPTTPLPQVPPTAVAPTMPPAKPPQPPYTISPLIVSPPITQHAVNLTIKSQKYSANIQNVSMSQPQIVNIKTPPVKLYQNVSAQVDLRKPDFSIRPNISIKTVGDPTPLTLYVKVIEENGTKVVYVPVKRDKTLKKLAIKKLKGKLTLESDDIVATTESTVEINESGIYVGTGEEKTELKVFPGEASKIAEDVGMGTIENIELKEVGQKPVYELKGSKKGKLLAVIPIDMKVELHVSGNTGEVMKKKAPWWSFLVRG